MAYGRKRVYAGAPRSVGFKRRRFSKRRFTGRRRNANFSSARGNVSTLGIRRKRGGYRKYKRMLWDASTMSTHYRSFIARDATVTTPASNLTLQTTIGHVIPNSFWLTAGGAVTSLTPVADSDIYIRGGMAKLAFGNDSGENVNVAVWMCRTTPKGAIPGSSAPAVGWDPTVNVDFQSDFRVLFKREFVLAPTEAQIIQHKIRAEKLDTSMFNLEYNRDFWYIAVSSVTTSAAVVQVTASHNLSYTIDV